MTQPKLAQEVRGKGRMYPSPHGDMLPSVTNVLGLLDKSGPLSWWAARTAIEHAADNFGDFSSALMLVSGEGEDARYNALKPFIGAYRKKRDDAADAGTSIHEWFEGAVNAGNPNHPSDDLSEDGHKFLLAASNLVRVESPGGATEQTVIGQGYGGTLDLHGTTAELAHRGDIVYDLKSRGNDKHAVYESEVFQLAALRYTAYTAEVDDHGEPIFQSKPPAEGAAIITVTPTNGYRIHDLTDVANENALRGFLGLVQMWHAYHEAKKGISAVKKQQKGKT